MADPIDTIIRMRSRLVGLRALPQCTLTAASHMDALEADLDMLYEAVRIPPPRALVQPRAQLAMQAMAVFLVPCEGHSASWTDPDLTHLATRAIKAADAVIQADREMRQP